MTSTNSATPDRAVNEEADDNVPRTFTYGHGRMPLFLKLAWVVFLAFATWYVVTWLLASVAKEVGG